MAVDPIHDTAPGPAPDGEVGRFTQGSTMRHVAVMTLTGSLGLTFMFLVDFVTLLYVSMLGDERLTSAVGYAWTIQFFTVSIGMGFSIAGTALVSRELGARRRSRARGIASSVITAAAVFLTGMAVTITLAREWALSVLGAEGYVLEKGAEFLLIAMPSLPFMAFGMLGGAVLRAVGDARRAMLVTFSGGVSAAVAAPFLIFESVGPLPGLGLGLHGAAGGLVATRLATAAMGFWFAVMRHDLVAWPSLSRTLGDLRMIARIAAPSSLTQLSTPFANFVLTAAISAHGASAVAGWAVVSRMTVLAFAGVFSLSAAIGGIIGQNYGARRFDRVRTTYRDALIFCAFYVGAAWAILWAASGLLAEAFSLSSEGAEVVRAFGRVGAGGFLFAGAAFVAVAAFNALGRPLWATASNWARDAGAVPLMLAVFGAWGLGANGVIYAQAAGMALAGVASGWLGWLYVRSLERRAVAAGAQPAE
jgi:Na+-driven multidrug efflux pump